MVSVVGIDVGGTNTDAVCLRDGVIVALSKVPTTEDVQGGVLAALAEVRSGEPVDRIHIGTTAFTNALTERTHLAPAAAVRIGAPVSESLPPMIDWPTDLRAAADNPVFFVAGGREYNGRPIRPLDRSAVTQIASTLKRSGVTQAAITAVFGTSYPDDEIQVGQWMRAVDCNLGISLSHRIGGFGLLERETATLLNAMLKPLAVSMVAAYEAAVPSTLFVSQNDGTVMRADVAAEFPVLTLASGPTNSLRGAAALTRQKDAIVVDVGGTTTDIGVLRNGYPQLAGLSVEVAGVRTNFRMPNLCSIGVGGGSVVDPKTAVVGPRSVGFHLTEDALAFGGQILTLTDIAVAAGRVDIGDRARVQHLESRLIRRVDERLRARFARLLESFELPGEHLPIVLVGGAAALVADLFKNLGHEVICPKYAGIANAYGAAIAQVGGTAEFTCSLNTMSRVEALARAEREARRRAEAAGAKPDSIEILEVGNAALSYLASDAVRVRARAVGNLDVAS